MASIPAETPKTRVPLPPLDARVVTTACEYSPVACGYKAFIWPVGTEGGPSARDNALKTDFPTGTFSGRWPSPNMHTNVTIDGRLQHVLVMPDPDAEVVNVGGNHSVRGGTLALKLYRPDGPPRRTDPRPPPAAAAARQRHAAADHVGRGHGHRRRADPARRRGARRTGDGVQGLLVRVLREHLRGHQVRARRDRHAQLRAAPQHGRRHGHARPRRHGRRRVQRGLRRLPRRRRADDRGDGPVRDEDGRVHAVDRARRRQAHSHGSAQDLHRRVRAEERRGAPPSEAGHRRVGDRRDRPLHPRAGLGGRGLHPRSRNPGPRGDRRGRSLAAPPDGLDLWRVPRRILQRGRLHARARFRDQRRARRFDPARGRAARAAARRRASEGVAALREGAVLESPVREHRGAREPLGADRRVRQARARDLADGRPSARRRLRRLLSVREVADRVQRPEARDGLRPLDRRGQHADGLVDRQRLDQRLGGIAVPREPAARDGPRDRPADQLGGALDRDRSAQAARR